MDKLLLSRNGTLKKKGKKISQNPLNVLSNLIELEHGYTLGSFFSMFKKYEILIQLSELLEPLAQMASNAGDNYPKDPEINRLIFYKTIAMKGFPGKPGVEIYNSLKGVKDGETIGLKFFQMESLMEHELCLGELKHIIFGDSQDMFTYETHYSLYELIEGVSWELSFNFNPLQCSIRG